MLDRSLEVIHTHTYTHTQMFTVSEAFDEIGRILSASGGEMKHKYDIGPKFQGFSAVMNET